MYGVTPVATPFDDAPAASAVTRPHDARLNGRSRTDR